MATIRGHGATRGALRGAIDGAKIWWVAPTFKTANEIIWPDLKKACRGAWVRKSETEKSIELPGGGSVTVKSADDPDNLRGAGLDGMVVDEAAYMSRHVWAKILRPMLADRRGWAMFISTPKGKNWFHKLFARAGTDAGWAAWQMPTSVNPIITQAELAELLLDLGPLAYAQEVLAQFVEDVEGAEFPAEYFGDSIWFSHWPRDVRYKAVALDPSKGKSDKVGDYSAFVKLLVDSLGGLYVDAVVERMNPSLIVETSIEIGGTFRPDAFGVETNQFQELLADDMARVSQSRGLMLPLYHVDNRVNKRVRIRRLTPYLSRGLIRFKAGSKGAKLLVEQLQGFPVGDHDDGPDALEMAIRLYRDNGHETETPDATFVEQYL